MAIELRMPKLGLTMIDGRIVEWKKKDGEKVSAGDIVCIIETEKATYEIEAPGAGVMAGIVAGEGVTVPIAGLMAYILQPGEILPGGVTETRKAALKKETIAAPVIKEAVTARAEASADDKLKVSPLARKIAGEHNINITTIKGTGPGGRIVKEDILQAIEARKSGAPAEAGTAGEKVVPLTGMRRTIARRMSQSFQTAPHFWVIAEADTSELIKLRRQLVPEIEKKNGVKLTFTDLLVKLVAAALKDHPLANASWTEEGIKILSEINIGIATDVPGGLIVPVVRHADRKNLAEIATARNDLITRGRAGKLNLDEMTGSTFTLNNVGAVGIKCIDAIINPPESAILTIGSTTDRVVAIDGMIAIRPVMDLSLACDHRVLDGASGGRFLMKVKELIEQPAKIIS